MKVSGRSNAAARGARLGARRGARRVSPGAAALALLALVVGAGGCDSPAAPLVDREPDLVGEIQEYDAEFSLAVRLILVKEDPEEACGVVVGVRSSTRLRAQDGSGRTGKATRADLVPGTRVRVWFDGAVMDSCPQQATAEAVELLW